MAHVVLTIIHVLTTTCCWTDITWLYRYMLSSIIHVLTTTCCWTDITWLYRYMLFSIIHVLTTTWCGTPSDSIDICCPLDYCSNNVNLLTKVICRKQRLSFPTDDHMSIVTVLAFGIDVPFIVLGFVKRILLSLVLSATSYTYVNLKVLHRTVSVPHVKGHSFYYIVTTPQTPHSSYLWTAGWWTLTRKNCNIDCVAVKYGFG